MSASWERVADTLQRVAPPEPRMRIETCACGRQIRADRFDPLADVVRHNRTKQHQAWRARMGYDW